MTDITPDRYAVLRAWFDDNAQNFNSETSLTVAAIADTGATGSEVDMVALWGRELRAEIEGQGTLDDLEKDLEDGSPQGEPAANVTETTDGAGSGDGQVGEPRQAPDVSAYTPAPADTTPDEAPAPPVQSTELVLSDEEREFGLDQRRAKAYALSGYWKDATQLAQALVKVEAGRELGIPSIVAMADIYVVDGKPQLGASIQATLVKQSWRYDYRVTELTNERCAIAFFERGTEFVIGTSEFTMEDATNAGLLSKKGDNWKRYPRNMLFARAMTNGVAWFCPDVLGGRFYDPDELTRD